METRLEQLQGGTPLRDVREMNPLQMAYIGDTVHDLYVRSRLLSGRKSVGGMHKDATKLVSAGAQAALLAAIAGELTPEEADIVRRGWNTQAKHTAPKHADAADYAHATGLEALWGYLYIQGRIERLSELMGKGLDAIWERLG